MDNQSQAPPQSTAPEAVPSQQTQNPMGPQPQPSMMQPQPLGGIPPPGGSSNKGLGIKCAYILVGLVGMALALAALKNSIYYETVCTDEAKEQLEKNRNRYPADAKCEEGAHFSYDQCKRFEQDFDKVVKQYKDQGYTLENGYRIPSCPSKWLVEPQAYMLAITWGMGGIALIITIFLSQQQSGDPNKFSKIDSIVFFVIGSITLLCALLMLVFFIWLVSSDFWCGHEKTGQLQLVLCDEKFAWGSFSLYGWFLGVGNCYRFGGSSASSIGNPGTGRVKIRGLEKDQGKMLLQLSKITDCSSFNTEVFQPWLLLVGTLFAGAAGIIAIVGGVLLMKKSGPSQGMAAGGQYNNLGLQNNNMGMMGNKSMGPYQQTSQMQMAGGSQYPQPQQQYGYGNQPQNMQMMGQQQQQHGQPTPSWQAMQAQAAQQYRAGRGGPR